MSGDERRCGCDWDPTYHRDLNIRRAKPEAGSACTNTVDPHGFGGDTGVCTSCIFGCAP